ncbi:MAG: hypothetical protein ACLRSW_15490 [Christensenellaceae bacterium]
MSKNNVGALIVFRRAIAQAGDPERRAAGRGDSTQLIEEYFSPRRPCTKAMIIRGHK